MRPQSPALPHHDPDMEGDAQSQISCRQDNGPFKLVEEEVDQAGLEDEGVEKHEEDDDDVEEDGDILDAVRRQMPSAHSHFWRSQPSLGPSVCPPLERAACWTANTRTALPPGVS